jgi:galactose mutarotase-like enzyme
MDRHTITGGGLTASVLADGAELCSVRDGADHEYIWQALPIWPRHAPVLFPIVGRLKGDALHHDGKTYKLTQHGFARDRRFTWSERTPASCRLTLVDDAATRALYPFAFRFEVAYALGADGLAITYTIHNPGTEVLPASMGAHPALAWPLVPGIAKEAHTLTFEHEETAPLYGVKDGLLTARDRPSPVQGRVLHLSAELFAKDALIFDRPASRWVRFAAPGAPTLRFSWEGFPQLGVWMRIGGDFLCIEPWLGTASPADFDGDFIDKPNLAKIAPGGSVSASHHIAIEA